MEIFFFPLLISILFITKITGLEVTCINETLSTISPCCIVDDSNLTINTHNFNLTHNEGPTIYKAVKIFNKNVSYFPTFDVNFFDQIQLIFIVNSGLKEIHQNDLKTLTKMTHLSLSGNDLSSLDAGTFKFNTYLEFLDLSDNEITQIHTNAFLQLAKLNFLNLTNNFCVSVEKSGRDVEILVKDILKDKCKFKDNFFDKIDDSKKIKYLIIGFVCLVVLFLLQSICCCCCLRKNKKAQKGSIEAPSLQRDRSNSGNRYRETEANANVSMPRVETATSTPALSPGSNLSLPRRKLSNISHQREVPTVATVTYNREPHRMAPKVPEINHSNLSPHIEKLQTVSSCENQYSKPDDVSNNFYEDVLTQNEKQNTAEPPIYDKVNREEPEHDYMKISDLCSGDGGYLPMHGVKQQASGGYLRVKPLKLQIDEASGGYMPMQGKKQQTQICDETPDGYMSMQRGVKSPVDETPHGYLSMQGAKALKSPIPIYEEASSGYMQMGSVKKPQEDQIYDEVNLNSEVLYENTMKTKVHYTDVMVGDGGKLKINQKKERIEYANIK